MTKILRHQDPTKNTSLTIEIPSCPLNIYLSSLIFSAFKKTDNVPALSTLLNRKVKNMKKVTTLSLALLTSALLSTHVSAGLAGSGVKSKSEHILSCTNGNFKGELKYIRYEDSKEVAYHPTDYRITRSNGQSGGNKANINTAATWVDASNKQRNVSHNSPDSMKQDGQWHVTNGSLYTTNPGTYRAYSAKFIFDKSGSDPSCTAYAYH